MVNFYIVNALGQNLANSELALFWDCCKRPKSAISGLVFFCPDFAIAPCSNRTDNNNLLINYLVPWNSSEVLKFDSADKMKKGRKMKITGQAFGVGAYEEEDEDIYNRDDMSRYDFSLGNDGEFSFLLIKKIS